MSKFLLLAALIGLGGLLWVCSGSHVPEIESDLTSRTTKALTDAGISYGAPAGLGFYNTLIAHLRGYKGSREISPEAQDIAMKVWGVSGVEIEEIPRPLKEEVQQKITEVLKLENVEFINGKAVMTDKGKATLDKIVTNLKPINDPVEIQGHTDSSGNPAANRRLSQLRADATKRYLESNGIGASRLTAVGYGADKPIADNATVQGRQRNRRIEFTLKEVVVPGGVIKKAN